MRPFSELRQMATMLRRNARQPDVIELCDALLELTTKRQRPKTDRKAYMRAYMAKYRKRGPK